jgi:hypothetical protein
MKQRYARVHNERVTHLALVQAGWIDENPWPRIPGEWHPAPEPVTLGWKYSTETNTFSPPDN